MHSLLLYQIPINYLHSITIRKSAGGSSGGQLRPKTNFATSMWHFYNEDSPGIKMYLPLLFLLVSALFFQYSRVFYQILLKFNFYVVAQFPSWWCPSYSSRVFSFCTFGASCCAESLQVLKLPSPLQLFVIVIKFIYRYGGMKRLLALLATQSTPYALSFISFCHSAYPLYIACTI